MTETATIKQAPRRPSRWPALVVLVLSMSSSAPAWAGPWTRSLGEMYLQTGERLFVADSFVDPSGQLVSDVEYLGASSFFYAEIGIGPRLQLTTYLPYTIALNTFGDGWKYMRGGWGDALLGLQWQPVESLLLALRADVKLPLYDVDRYQGDFEESFPALGNGNVDTTFWLSYGGSPGSSSLYLFGEVGYRVRTEAFIGGVPDGAPAFANGFAFSGQLGGSLSEHLMLSLSVGGVVPFARDDVSEGYLTIGQGVFAPITGGWAVVGSIDQTVWARNSSRGFGVSLGVAYSL